MLEMLLTLLLLLLFPEAEEEQEATEDAMECAGLVDVALVGLR